MSCIKLYTKYHADIEFAGDIPRDDIVVASLEEAIKLQLNEEKIKKSLELAIDVRLNKIINDGILCLVEYSKTNDRSFIPNRLFQGLDLDDSEDLAQFAKKVTKEWDKVTDYFMINRSLLRSKDEFGLDVSGVNEMVFAEPNTLIYRELKEGLTEREQAGCLTYRQKEIEQWGDKEELEEFFGAQTKASLSPEEKLLFRSLCFPKTSLHREKWKLSQAGIENCFNFFSVLERVVYKTIEEKPFESTEKDSSEAIEEETVVWEELFCSSLK